MKKGLLLALAATITATSSVAMAAPVNQLGEHETAVGVGTKDVFIEHKATDNLSVGAAWADRDEYGNPKDLYVNYDVIGQNLKLVGGYRWDMPGDTNNFFGGVAVATPVVMGFDAYASYVAGSDFNEVQVGLNKSLIANIDLNVNYHNFKPDHGDRENGVGVGVTVKF